jgi:hypothetical protein
MDLSLLCEQSELDLGVTGVLCRLIGHWSVQRPHTANVSCAECEACCCA